ncbi:MAG: thiol-disulfide isomerase/thioredoxin [Myxococcota bacterium]|jgi:thiol-disulfide isomerase/thioredoxin
MNALVHRPTLLSRCSLCLLLLVLSAAGCTSEETTEFVTGNTCETNAPMLDFTLDDCEGTPRSLSDLAGSKATLISIGAGWCGPCRDKQPELQRLHDTYSGCGLRLVTLLFESNMPAQPATKTFCKSWDAQYQQPFPTIVDPLSSVSEPCRNNQAVPITLVLDESGTVVYKAHGLLEDTEAVIQSLTGCQ